MDALLGPLLIAASLMAAAAALKVFDPAPTAGALRAMGLAAPPSAVRMGAGIELLLAASVVVVDHWLPAVLLALSYLGFATFVEAARRKGAMVGSCGCFGREDTPPSLVHVILDAALAAVCAAWATNGRGAPLELVPDTPWAGLPLVGLALLGAYLMWATLTLLPRTLAAARVATSAR